jgi:hypothetical protein
VTDPSLPHWHMGARPGEATMATDVDIDVGKRLRRRRRLLD